MLPVIISLLFSESATATYFLSQASTAANLPNKIARPPSPVYSGGGYPTPSPLISSLYPGFSSGYKPVKRSTIRYFLLRPGFGLRPNRPSTVSQPTLSELLSLLTNRGPTHNNEEKGQQTGAETLEGILNSIGGLRNTVPTADISDNEENAAVEMGGDQENVITSADGGNGMVNGLNAAKSEFLNRLVKEGLPTGSLPALSLYLVPSEPSGGTQVQEQQMPTTKDRYSSHEDVDNAQTGDMFLVRLSKSIHTDEQEMPAATSISES